MALRPATTLGRLLVLAALAGTISVLLAVIPGHRGWFDVGVYYGTVNYWVHDGGLIYDYLRPESVYGFTYPPFAAICMLPMAALGWHTAIAISVAISAASILALLYWLVDPIIRRHGWPRWFAYSMAVCLLALLESVRDTISFGQVNLALVALVFMDLWLLTARRSRLAGIGIGLAAAIKLTPAVFICYLLVTRRWRAAAVASGTVLAATGLAAMVAPGASRIFFTDAVWHTDRIGSLGYISNQSFAGLVARLGLGGPGQVTWGLAVLAVLAVWAYRVRRAASAGDDRTGFALTGLIACLISPITWVHHLVWTVPALILLIDAALRSGSPESRRRRLTIAATGYALLCSSVIWLWVTAPSGVIGFLGANTYVWVALGLLLFLPTPPPSRNLVRQVLPQRLGRAEGLPADLGAQRR